MMGELVPRPNSRLVYFLAETTSPTVYSRYTASNKGVRLYYFRFNGADGNKVDLIPVSVDGIGALFDRVSGRIIYNGLRGEATGHPSPGPEIGN